MRKLKIAIMAVLLSAGCHGLALADKPGSPAKTATQECWIEQGGDIYTTGDPQPISIVVWLEQEGFALNVTANLESKAGYADSAYLPGWGPYVGAARCLKKDGRFDFYFTNGTNNYQLVVSGGSYHRPSRTNPEEFVAFLDAPAILACKEKYQSTGDGLVLETTATFVVRFVN